MREREREKTTTTEREREREQLDVADKRRVDGHISSR